MFVYGGYGGFCFFVVWEYFFGLVDVVFVINDCFDINGVVFGVVFIYYIFYCNNFLSFFKDKNLFVEK